MQAWQLAAFWGFIPGYLKAKFNVNEIISTLMMNYIAMAWINFYLWCLDRRRFSDVTKVLKKCLDAPAAGFCQGSNPDLRGLTTHLGFIFGIVAAVIIWVILYRSRWGYEIRLIGDNPKAANYAGINITRNIICVMMLSGALAGLGGMSEITGVVHRLQKHHRTRLWVYRNHCCLACQIKSPVIIPVSILFGALILAGTRDPTIRDTEGDPGNYPGLPDRQ